MSFLWILAAWAGLVSTSPAITESVVSLGFGNQLVGVSNYCPHPARKVGTSITPDYEAVVKLNPRLVFVQDTKDKTVAENIGKLGFRVLSLKFDRLKDILDSYRKLARELKKPEKGERFSRLVESSLEKVSSKSYLLVVSSQVGKKLETARLAGSGTYFDDILSGLGLENRARGPVPYPVWDQEAILKSKADYVFLVFPQKFKTVQKHADAWKKLKPGARIKIVRGDHALVPGPGVLKLIKKFKDLL